LITSVFSFISFFGFSAYYFCSFGAFNTGYSCVFDFGTNVFITFPSFFNSNLGFFISSV